MPLTQKTKTILQDISKLIVVVLIFLMFGSFIGWAIGYTHEENKRKVEEKSFAEYVIKENKDSLCAFMSIIIEANQTLVSDPKNCRWLVLAEITQPCYISKGYENKLIFEKPYKESAFIWIPVDSVTWKDIKNKNISELKHPVYIGNSIYNGDLDKLKINVIDKKDRGF